jgi:protoporphyrinogen oxidase
VFERDTQVGGISRTVDHHGHLFDVGGHRFFTKSARIQSLWEEWLGPELRLRPRLSRIYYRRRFFHYPLKPVNALRGLGPLESARIALSYVSGRLRPRRDVRTFEDWVSGRFGKRLYEIFFKTYTEKVWGISCRELQADWAAQRIKSLSLSKAVLDSFGLMRSGKVSTLIDRFYYPDKGPGQMWDKARAVTESGGGRVELGAEAIRIRHEQGRVSSVTIRSSGSLAEARAENVLSSLPLKDLILSLDPAPPDPVVRAALQLRYRDFFTVGLVLEKDELFPDNWIYIHSPDVRVGRIQNFKNWSPRMVAGPGRTSLGLEYFCFETDDIWKASDGDLVALAVSELARLGLADPRSVSDATVIRSPKAYPIYDARYRGAVATIRDYLATFSNLQTMGRNGLHRYNNQDHSMLTALAAVANILGGKHSVWDINADDAYHEAV